MILLSQYPAKLRDFQGFLKKSLKKRHAAANAFCIFYTIYARCGLDSNTFISMKTIIDESLVGRDATLEGVKDLVRLHCIKKDPRTNEKGAQISNLYTIVRDGFMMQFFPQPMVAITDDDTPDPPTDDQDPPHTDDQDPKVIKKDKNNSNSDDDGLVDHYKAQLHTYASKEVRQKGEDYDVSLFALAKQIADMHRKGKWEEPAGKTAGKAYKKFVQVTKIRHFEEKKARRDVIREEEQQLRNEAMSKYHSEVKEVMHFVNSLLPWHLDSDEGHVSKLLFDGFLSEEICLVAAEKIYQWGDSDKMKGNITPYKLFGPSFEGALAALQAREEQTYPGGISYYSYLCRIRMEQDEAKWDNNHFTRSTFSDLMNPGGSYPGPLTQEERYELAIRFTVTYITSELSDGYRDIESYVVDKLGGVVKRTIKRSQYKKSTDEGAQ